MRLTFLLHLLTSILAVLPFALRVDVLRAQSSRLDTVIAGRDVDQWIHTVAAFPANEDWDSAAVVLRELGPRVTPGFITLLTDRDAQKRRNAAVALGWIGPAASSAVTILAQHVQDPNEDEWVRKHAAQALGQIGAAAQPAIPALIAVMRNPGDMDPWNWAAEALAGIGTTTLPTLLKALSDTNATFQGGILNAFADLGPLARPALPALKRVAQAVYGYNRISYRDAIEDISAPLFEPPMVSPGKGRADMRRPAPSIVMCQMAGRWRGHKASARGFRDSVYFVDLFPSGQFRQWWQNPTTGEIQTTTTGAWNVAAPSDFQTLTRTARAFCFVYVDGQRSCGTMFFKVDDDYSATLGWRPESTTDITVTFVRSPVPRMSP